MNSDSSRQTPQHTAQASTFRRMGVYRFLAILTLPILLLLCGTCFLIVSHLADIEKVADDVNQEHLPGILASQRTLINIENIRREVFILYTADNPVMRRNALISALALASESVLEPDSALANYAGTVDTLMRNLAAATTRSHRIADTLHTEELKFANIYEQLRVRAGLPSSLGSIHSAYHLSADEEIEQDDSRLAEVRNFLEPIQELCLKLPSHAERIQSDCRHFQNSWDTLTTARKDYISSDGEARALWTELDALLRKLSDDASSIEAGLTYSNMEHIRAQAQEARISLIIALLLLIGGQVVFVAVVHHFILSPIALASRSLRKIYFGLSTNAVPPARIRELQDLLDLLPSLSHHLAELNARSGLMEKEKERYASLSMHDALTGVYNRRSFDEELTRVNRSVALALLMLDVDFFKLYNDSCGHQAGDAALVAVAHAMERSLLRGTDKVFRYGGEEFAVLLPNSTEQAAEAVAERIRHNVRALALPHPKSSVAPILTVSIGVALRTCDDDMDEATLIKHADEALYHAKSNGRNQVCLYQPEYTQTDQA